LLPGEPPQSIDLGAGLSLRLYEDTRPHVGKIASLQKGPVLVRSGDELVEEGYGFGAPIVIVDGRQYLSRTARVEVYPEQERLVKWFEIDTEDTWTRPFRRKYRPVDPLGEIVFTYTVTGPGQLDVEADFTGLRSTPDAVYLANEQGASHFTRYSDSDGTDRVFADVPDTPDQWIPTTAPHTCFTAEKLGLRMCVETSTGQRKYVGRERYRQWRWSGAFALSWAGTDIEIGDPTGRFGYRVTVEELRGTGPG
jgi:hypothetical protein